VERIWFDQGRQNFFSIPDSATLPDGSYRLRCLTSASMKVEREAVEDYRISKEEASGHLGDRVEEAWGNLVGKVDALFAFGRSAAEGTETEAEAKTARSPLPENLEDVLGMKIGAILTEPDEVRARIKAAASSVGIKIKARAEQADVDVEVGSPEPEPETAEEVEGAEGAEGAEGDRTEDRAPGPADSLREFFSRPEVTGAISGLGRALSKLGAQIQEAAEKPTSEE
jgi:hypothetical protein